MRISAKGRYALASVTEIARRTGEGENISVFHIAKALGISKIYLEQVLVQLKKGGVILSVKGSKGGHQLAREPGKITVWDILITVENSLVESTESTVGEHAPEIEMMLKTMIFDVLDDAIKQCLSNITVQDMLDFSDQQRDDQSYMLYM
jgi:Rrf2 family protein